MGDEILRESRGMFIANCYANYFMSLLPHLLLRRLMIVYIQYVLFARHMSNRLSSEKIKKSQTLWKIVSEFTQLESP